MPMPKLIKVVAVGSLKLLLIYEIGELKVFDVKPYANGDWFGELNDPTYFSSVRMLSDGSGIEWRNGQDIAPHELYEQSIPV